MTKKYEPSKPSRLLIFLHGSSRDMPREFHKHISPISISLGSMKPKLVLSLQRRRLRGMNPMDDDGIFWLRTSILWMWLKSANSDSTSTPQWVALERSISEINQQMVCRGLYLGWYLVSDELALYTRHTVVHSAETKRDRYHESLTRTASPMGKHHKCLRRWADLRPYWTYDSAPEMERDACRIQSTGI